jgi:hypothetical protein
MQYGMFTQEGDHMVFSTVVAAKQMMKSLGTTPGDAYDFAERRLELLASSEMFKEAMDTVVRESVYQEIYGVD